MLISKAMQESHNIFLPGGFKQFKTLKGKFSFSSRAVLIIGSGTEKIAEKMIKSGSSKVKIIVNDVDSLLTSKLQLHSDLPIETKLMDFDNTDFADKEFDLIYAQGSISSTNRNKIIKEIKRVLKPEGTFCVGEITSLEKVYPKFIKEIFESSDLLPLFHEECEKYYNNRMFDVLFTQDLSSSLKSFYENAAVELKKNIDKLSGQEKSYYKKLLNKISHESNAFLNLGADKYIGFKMLILKLSASAS
ncbi:MAG: class I SAM-dependent methyltransferase [Ignavibacteriaceae bacterium]|nr:class I SAM-dependent methyltransferase [Ignavibacteriaceae bacterium]